MINNVIKKSIQILKHINSVFSEIVSFHRLQLRPTCQSSSRATAAGGIDVLCLPAAFSRTAHKLWMSLESGSLLVAEVCARSRPKKKRTEWISTREERTDTEWVRELSLESVRLVAIWGGIGEVKRARRSSHFPEALWGLQVIKLDFYGFLCLEMWDWLKCSDNWQGETSVVNIRGGLGNSLLSSASLFGVLNMEKEIEDMFSGNRWKEAYEVSELSSTHCLFGGS